MKHHGLVGLYPYIPHPNPKDKFHGNEFSPSKKSHYLVREFTGGNVGFFD